MTNPMGDVTADRQLIAWALNTLGEINVSNYDHDDVCRLNDKTVEVALALQAALAASPESEGAIAEFVVQNADLKVELQLRDAEIATLKAQLAERDGQLLALREALFAFALDFSGSENWPDDGPCQLNIPMSYVRDAKKALTSTDQPAGQAREQIRREAFENSDTFQRRVAPWMQECFGAEIAADITERNHRFLEEALELVQSKGCTASEAQQLVDYVYGRDIGEVNQEVGGVMVTLAALCLAANVNMHQAGEKELERVWGKVDQIRAKQAAKPDHSPLPGPTIRSLADKEG